MRKHFSDVKTLTGRDQTKIERKLNMLMFSVVILFIISYSFDNMFFVLIHFETDLSRNTTRFLVSFGAVLLTLNSSINIFFYSYFNEKFRKILGKILLCEKEKVESKYKLSCNENKKQEVSNSYSNDF